MRIPDLLAYLDQLSTSSSMSSDLARMQYDGKLAEYAASNQFELEMFNSVIEAGKTAVNALLIVNGGAVVAMLGVVSNLITKDGGATLARLLALPLLQFGLGVLLAAICFALRYFSQAMFAEMESDDDKFSNWGSIFRYAAVLVGLLGYVAFGFGLVNSYIAINTAL